MISNRKATNTAKGTQAVKYQKNPQSVPQKYRKSRRSSQPSSRTPKEKRIVHKKVKHSKKMEYIIQWNVKGMTSGKSDLLQLREDFHPSQIAVQETFHEDQFMDRI